MCDKRERSMQRRNSRLLLHDSNISKPLDPIIDYAQEPLLSLPDACAPLIDIVDDILKYVSIALDRISMDPPNKLTKDEAAAIHLYTMEWEDGHKSLYSLLNLTLRAADRTELKPWFKYLKLFLTALVKIPCAPSQTVWRGVRKNISDEFSPGTQVTWWSFSSCTTSLTVLESDMYLGNVGERTLFSIELFNGRTIRNYSHFDTEDEILMLPGTRLEVQSRFSPAPDLHIVHLKQMLPKETLVEIPFQGACLYPKPKRHWYRKKRFSFMMVVVLAIVILASVLGSRAIHRVSGHISNLFLANTTNVIDNSSISYIVQRLKVGRIYSSIITGTTNGSIYGTNIYTADSDLGTAAVHAGILHIGETRNITIRILSGQACYVASMQNGISSFSYGPWTKSYSFVNSTVTFAITPNTLADYDGQVGQTVSYVVTGAINGYIYGTTIYTDDSSLATAAVHAGVLGVGEARNITIQILSGQASYRASIQNGVSSLPYGAWTRSYSFS